MKYIKNNLDYAVAFTVTKDSREKKFVFDCFRQYSDTGNVVTTGVTDIEEADYNFLYKECMQFKKFIDKGFLSITNESGALGVANKMDALEKENAKLRAELEAKTKEASTATSEEMDAVKAENESLKAQLEALAGKKGKGKGAETEAPEEDKGAKTEAPAEDKEPEDF